MIYGNTVLHDADALRRSAVRTPKASIRAPRGTDGAAIWALIRAQPSLDDNSLYCNLLQATHFAPTCALAEQDDKVVGWVSAYIPPEQPDTLFVWQVCVDRAARGQGLGRRLIADVLSRPACRHVSMLECTITDDNEPSWSLFRSIARRLGAQLQQAEHFLRDAHFAGQHDSEFAVRIGPFDPGRFTRLTGQ
ncbi:diaminobutyrate acetyltransferase [Devosia sp. XK-2]|uniref:diaminobutyrate acetyltransferase n=1 Tax=Devosia sp. XK-2 TaxID=3126689 RepID=UPI0030CE23AA